MREKHVAEINRLSEAIRKTKSRYLKKDYLKTLSRMKEELKEYDQYKGNMYG